MQDCVQLRESFHRAYKEYPVIHQTGQHEIDASAVLDSVFAVIREVSERHGDIEAVGVTSFGETFVLADGEGRPLHTAMLYTDSRGSEQCRELTKKLGAMHLAETAGVKPHEMYSIPKIMWMKEQRPELYQKAKHIFLMEDLIVFALTGTAQIDYSLAARTMGFDIHKLRWSQEIFEAAGIDMGLMSSPVPTGTCAGTPTKAAAEKTGLPERTMVVSISHDQIAAAVGAGVFSSEIAVDGAGTVECITPIYDEIPDMEVMARGNYAVVPYGFRQIRLLCIFLYRRRLNPVVRGHHSEKGEGAGCGTRNLCPRIAGEEFTKPHRTAGAATFRRGGHAVYGRRLQRSRSGAYGGDRDSRYL